MRRIAVNGATLLRGIAGIPRLTRYLIDALHTLPDVEVRVVTPTRQRGRSSVLNAIGDTWWDFRGAEAAADGADLLVSPCNIGGARRTPHLLCVADIMPLEHPEYFDRKFARYFRTVMPYALRRATRVITNSNHVRQRLLELAPRADIHILALPGGRTPRPRVGFPVGIKRALVVGATEPHKNQVAAVTAVALAREHHHEDLRLDLVGPVGRAEATLAEHIRRMDPTGAWVTRHVGISDAALDALYAAAWVLIQPSINEGYGLPLVESAEHGLPAIHSGAGAMTEVAPLGNAGGTDPESLMRALGALLDRAAWEAHAAGVREIAKQRSWDAFKRQLRDIVEPMLGSR